MSSKGTAWSFERQRPITSKRFIDALVMFGVIGAEDLVTRVVIDARANDLVTIHVERHGDDRLLDVVRTLEGVEVRERAHPHTAADCGHKNCPSWCVVGTAEEMVVYRPEAGTDG